MKPVLPGDISAAARVLLKAPKDRRLRLALDLVSQARFAEIYVHIVGQAHPQWGTGSIMSAALQHPLASEPGYDDPDYAACTIQVLKALHGRCREDASLS